MFKFSKICMTSMIEKQPGFSLLLALPNTDATAKSFR